MTTIATLPAAPNKATDSAATFSSKADALVAALGDFVSQANSVAGEVNTAAGTAASDAADAAVAAATALAAPGTNATSTSSMTPATGAKSFTLAEADKDFVVGMAVMVADTAAPSANWMHGIITAFTPASGAMTVEVDLIGGTPAVASAWTVSISGPVVVAAVEEAAAAASSSAASAASASASASSAASTAAAAAVAAVAASSVGVGQTWQKPVRGKNVAYLNNTGKPICVAIVLGVGASVTGDATLFVGPTGTPTIEVASFYFSSASSPPPGTCSVIVPNNNYYKLVASANVVIVYWSELR